MISWKLYWGEKFNYMREIDFLLNYLNRIFWVSWKMTVEGLGVQMTTRAPAG